MDPIISFDLLPMDVIVLMFSDYKDIENLCQSSQVFNDKYCRNSNGEFWSKMLYNYYGEKPSGGKTYKEQYKIYYDNMNKVHKPRNFRVDRITAERLEEINKTKTINNMLKIYVKADQLDKIFRKFKELGESYVIDNYQSEYVYKVAAMEKNIRIMDAMYDYGIDIKNDPHAALAKAIVKADISLIEKISSQLELSVDIFYMQAGIDSGEYDMVDYILKKNDIFDIQTQDDLLDGFFQEDIIEWIPKLRKMFNKKLSEISSSRPDGDQGMKNNMLIERYHKLMEVITSDMNDEDILMT